MHHHFCLQSPMQWRVSIPVLFTHIGHIYYLPVSTTFTPNHSSRFLPSQSFPPLFVSCYIYSSTFSTRPPPSFPSHYSHSSPPF